MQTLKEIKEEPEVQKNTYIVRTKNGEFYKKVPNQYLKDPEKKRKQKQRLDNLKNLYANTCLEIRNELNLTQKELSILLNVDQTTVSNWEIRKHAPQKPQREQIEFMYTRRTDEGKIYLTESMFKVLEETRAPLIPVYHSKVKPKNKILTLDNLFYATLTSIVGYVAYHVMIYIK